MLDKKKIADINWSKVLFNGRTIKNLKLIPSETVCPFCTESEVPLKPMKLKRKSALLLCIDGIGNVETYTKSCPSCGATISYHDHDPGIGVFNFDNNLVLSLALLKYW